MSIKIPLQLFSLLIFSFLCSCGPTQEMLEVQQEQRTADSLDSVSVAMEKFKADSIRKDDSISKLPCPDLDEYVRLNERELSIIRNMNDANEKSQMKIFDRVSDSISAEQKNIAEHKISTMEKHCVNRFMALMIYYTKEMTNASVEGTPYEKLMPQDQLNKRADSIMNMLEHKN